MSLSASCLIAAVHRRKALWDPHDVHHHNRVVVNGLWQEVGSEIGVNMITAKSKWRGLRDYYRQQMRRNAETSDDMMRCHSSWAHFDEMSFLDGTIPQRRSASEVIMKEEPCSPTEKNANTGSNQKWDNMWVDVAQPGNSTYPNYAESEVSDVEDEDLHFFKSLLPDLRSLTRPKKAFIRLRIQELIFREVYGGENTDETRLSTQDVGSS